MQHAVSRGATNQPSVAGSIEITVISAKYPSYG